MANCTIRFYLFLCSAAAIFHSTNSIEGTEFELQNRDSSYEATFKYAMNTCKIKERVSDDEIERIVTKFLPSTKTEKCFVACWLESFHVINNRRFIREQYVKLSTYGQYFDGNKQKKLEQILLGCKIPDCKLERCELAYRIMKCVDDGAKKLGLNPKDL